ncbi:MAG: N-acetyltransferase [Syntrophobacteraceae bacterium]
MRFLLDTNLLIPLEDSESVMEAGLAGFFRMAHENNHLLVVHPASEDELSRDSNPERRKQNLDRVRQFTPLEERPPCPWNTPYTRPNDAVDHELLYALQSDLVHALITEDRSLFDKARERGLSHRVFSIQTAEDWLRRLYDTKHVRLPHIEDVSLDALLPELDSEFFRDLRDRHPGFDEWFKDKAREGRKAWVFRERVGIPEAICIYARKDEDTVIDPGLRLERPSLELCTFKVAPSARARKIGELFIRAAFRFATENQLENIFIHGDADRDHALLAMLEDFGFARVGSDSGSAGRDAVYLKPHPVEPPADMVEPLEYLNRFFPHFRHDPAVNKIIIPLRPREHRILFPDYHPPSGRQLSMFSDSKPTGNAIKLAHLVQAPARRVHAGDVALFYRLADERALTSVGVVESFETPGDAAAIAVQLKRRTVHSMAEIERMAVKPTKVLLFRLVKHLRRPVHQSWLESHGILKSVPQRIMPLSHLAFEEVLASGEETGTRHELVSDRGE